MRQVFEVPGRLPGLNEYTSACRTNPYAGAKLKREATEACMWAAKAAGVRSVAVPVDVHVTWVEPNTRRDKDNIRFAIKFVLDALVRLGVIPDDGWGQVGSLSDSYMVNRSNPRVIVTLECKEEE